MSLSALLATELQQLVGTAVSASEPDVADIAIDLTTVESLSYSFSELRLSE